MSQFGRSYIGGAVKVYGEVQVWINMFLPSTLDNIEWLDSFLDRFTPGDRPAHSVTGGSSGGAFG